METEPSWQALRGELFGQISLQRTLLASAASASGILGTFFVVLVYTGFLLAERGVFARKIARLSSDPARVARIRQVIGDINARIGAYLVMKTLINLLLGGSATRSCACWGRVRRALGDPDRAVQLHPLPGVGPGVLPPVLMAALQFGDFAPTLVAAAALIAAQTVVGSFVDPWLMGRSVNLSPFVILVSLVFWSAIWGVSGAILSVPVTAILVIVLSEFRRPPHRRPAVAGRPGGRALKAGRAGGSAAVDGFRPSRPARHSG